jgi:hypothetical protein
MQAMKRLFLMSSSWRAGAARENGMGQLSGKRCWPVAESQK